MPFFVDTEKCLVDRGCVNICPVDAFKEADDYLVIDPDECVSCGACVGICPEKAIFREDSDQISQEQIDKNISECKDLPLAKPKGA